MSLLHALSVVLIFQMVIAYLKILKCLALYAEALQQLGIELAALSLGDHAERLFLGKGVLVDPLINQRVIHIHDGDNLRADGNPLFCICGQ